MENEPHIKKHLSPYGKDRMLPDEKIISEVKETRRKILERGPTKATYSLVLGILSIALAMVQNLAIVGIILGVAGIVVGVLSNREKESSATWGILLSVIGLVMGALMLFIGLALTQYTLDLQANGIVG